MGLHRDKSLTFFLRNDFARAISYFDNLCRIEYREGNIEAYVECYLWKARFTILVGEYLACQSTLESLYSSHALIIKADDYLLGLYHYLEASILYYRGRSDDCLEAAKQAEKHFCLQGAVQNGSIEYLLTMHMLGKAYWLKRDISNALYRLIEGAQVNAENLSRNNSFALAKSYNLIGSVLMDFRRVDAAQPFFRLSEQTYKNYASRFFLNRTNSSRHLYVGILYTNIAECKLRNGGGPNQVAYKEYFEEGKAIFDKLYQNRPHRYSATLLSIKARYHKNLNTPTDLSQSLSNLDQEIAMRNAAFKGDKHSSIARAHNNKSRIHLQCGEYGKAMQEAQAALIQSVNNFNDSNVEKSPCLSSATVHFSGTEMLKALSNKAEASLLRYQQHKDGEDISRAARMIRAALNGIFHILSQDINHTESQFLFLEDTRYLHELAIRILVQLTADQQYNRYPYTLYEIVQYNKSILLLEDLNNSDSSYGSLYSQGSYVQSIQLSEELKEGAKEMLSFPNDSFKHQTKNKLKELLKLLDEKNTPVKSADFASLIKKKSIRHLQQEMEKDRVATLEYFVGRNDVYGILLDSQQIKVQQLTGKGCAYDTGGIKKLVKRYNILLSREIPQYRYAPAFTFRVHEDPKPDFIQLSHLFYEVLVAPFLDELSSADDVYIIPDDFLWHLPFETLIEERQASLNYHQLAYIQNKWQISYHFSLPLIYYQYNNNGKSPRSKVQSMLCALGETDALVDDTLLKTMMKWKDTMGAKLHAYARDLSHSDDSPTVILNKIIADIILIWSHGGMNDGIRIDKDRRIRMEDIQTAAPLRWKLLIVPNCYFGNGIMRDGEGMIALHRSFYSKGVENMIYTLTNLPADGTIRILDEFFHIIASKSSVSISYALREAKRKVSREQDSVPSDWAGLLFLGHLRGKL